MCWAWLPPLEGGVCHDEHLHAPVLRGAQHAWHNGLRHFPRKRRTRAPVLTGGPGAAPGGVASKNGICAYRGGSFPIAHDACVCATKMAVGLSAESWNYFDTFGVVFFGGGALDVAEDVLSAAKDGSDLAQDVAADVLGAAKNGSTKVLIVKVFILSVVKPGAGHAASFLRLPLVARTQSAS